MGLISASFMDFERQAIEDYWEKIDKYQRYYDGNHDLKMPDASKKVLESTYGLVINYCAPVVDALVAKLKIDGILCDDDKARKWLWDLWRKNKALASSIKVHRNSIISGDSYLIAWPDDNNDIHIYFNPSDAIYPMYDEVSGERFKHAIKMWHDHDKNGVAMMRMNKYYTDRVEKYSSTDDTSKSPAKNWTPIERVENPFNILPVVHFKNKLVDTALGESELVNVIGPQDAINKMGVDLLKVADLHGFPQTTVSGLEGEIVPDTGLESGPGEVWMFNNQVKVSQLVPADLTNLRLAIDGMIENLCEISATPRSALGKLTGGLPSGESLERSHAALNNKALERQISLGDGYERLNQILLTMGKYLGQYNGEIPPETEIRWKSVSPQDRSVLTNEIAMKLEKYVISRKQALREFGYTEDEIVKIFKEAESDKENDIDKAIRSQITPGGIPREVIDGVRTVKSKVEGYISGQVNTGGTKQPPA